MVYLKRSSTCNSSSFFGFLELCGKTLALPSLSWRFSNAASLAGVSLRTEVSSCFYCCKAAQGDKRKKTRGELATFYRMEETIIKAYKRRKSGASLLWCYCSYCIIRTILLEAEAPPGLGQPCSAILRLPSVVPVGSDQPHHLWFHQWLSLVRQANWVKFCDLADVHWS